MKRIPNKNYKIGRAWEYKAKADLEKLGYKVFRQAGSHTEADLIAFKGAEVRFIQIKHEKKSRITNQNIPPRLIKEIDGLRAMVNALAQPDYYAELWVKSKAKGWAVRRYKYGNGI